jgi:ABC-type glycerol-3-phosphate transport system permease component
MKKFFFANRRKLTWPLWVAFVIILLYALTLLTPLYYMLINSFKRVDDFLLNGCWKMPKAVHWQNFEDAIQLTSGKVSFVGMYINSIILTVSAVLISTATATMTAYALARYNFFGRDFLVALGVGSLVIPNLGSSTVIYKLFVDMNAIDTWLILIQYTTPFGMQFLILYGLFKTVAGTYVDAARIDGAGEWCIFLRICVPMAKGALGATMVILAINNWNDYYTPYMYLPSIKTLSIGLQELTMTVSQLDRPKLFAGMVVALTPLMIIFIAMRDVIIENTVAGGLKG